MLSTKNENYKFNHSNYFCSYFFNYCPNACKKIQNLQSANSLKLNRIKYVKSKISLNQKIKRVILRNIQDYILNNSNGLVHYYYNKVDLNGDVKPKLLVYFVALPVCGSGGCNTLIFKLFGTDYQLI